MIPGNGECIIMQNSWLRRKNTTIFLVANNFLIISLVSFLVKFLIVFFGLTMCFFMNYNEINAYAADEFGNIVIVIDPGHGGTEGGTQDGASSNGILEKNINMDVAKAMKQELESYGGVKVYLTHKDANVSMSIARRAAFAKSVGADFVYSIHFNASESKDKFGAELWIPSVGNYYVCGKQYGDILENEFKSLGVFWRGIRTRIGDDGDEYYGIIRECEWKGIPAVIIEHCHMDNKNDEHFFMSESIRNEFGIADATAVAKYFGLKNDKNDFTDYKKTQVEVPTQRVYPDETPPEICILSLNEKTEKGCVSFTIDAIDSGSGINYYSYSLDGGKEYSELFVWNDEDSDNKVQVTLVNINEKNVDLMVRVYNKSDMVTVSNLVSFNMKNGGIGENRDGGKQEILFNKISSRMKKNILFALLLVAGIGLTVLLKGRRTEKR